MQRSAEAAADGDRDQGDRGPAFSPEAIEFFESRVRPILVDQCVKCHGEKKQSTGCGSIAARRRSRGATRGPAVVAGKPDESLLVQAVAQTHAELKMPPTGKLPDAAVATLRQWVAQGAPWPAVSTASRQCRRERPAQDAADALGVPARSSRSSPPPVKDRTGCSRPSTRSSWPGSRRPGSSPSPPASKRTLIRRATIDLWGIPPTAEEVEAFEADPSPDAFARLVDRLLASPRYGERWGRHWLDVARYADTKGYVFTQDRRYPLRLHLPRLRDRGVQRRPALRSVRRPAARRRSARRAARTAGRWPRWGS